MITFHVDYLCDLQKLSKQVTGSYTERLCESSLARTLSCGEKKTFNKLLTHLPEKRFKNIRPSLKITFWLLSKIDKRFAFNFFFCEAKLFSVRNKVCHPTMFCFRTFPTFCRKIICRLFWQSFELSRVCETCQTRSCVMIYDNSIERVSRSRNRFVIPWPFTLMMFFGTFASL